METPGLGHGRFLGDCDVNTPGWRYDGASSFGCDDGAPDLECSGVTCFIVPALGWDGVPKFRGGTCNLEFMGNRVPRFWCDRVLDFRSNRVLEFEGTRAADFVLRVG